MINKKIVRFPISARKRSQNLRGPLAVPCQISDRWLTFSSESALLCGGEFIGLDVMTLGADGRPRKMCQMYVTREDLLEVLGKVKPKPDE